MTSTTKAPPNQDIRSIENSAGHVLNVFITSSKGGESYHSTPQRIYDQIAELRKERTEDGKRRYPVSHIDRLAEFYALVKKNYGWVSNSPAELSRKQIADVFDCSLDTASDLVEVARKTGFVFAERNNYTKNGKTRTKGYLITLTLMTASANAFQTLERANSAREQRGQYRQQVSQSDLYQDETTSTTDGHSSISVSRTASQSAPPLHRRHDLVQSVGTTPLEVLPTQMSTDWEVLPTQMSTDWEVLPTVKLDSSLLNSKVNSRERTTSTSSQTQLIETLLSEKTSDATSASRHLRKRYGVSRLDALTSSTADEIIKGLIGGTLASWLCDQTTLEMRNEAESKATDRRLADQSEPRPSREQAKLNIQKLRDTMHGRAPSEF
jgi:hypothetical protein